MKTRTDLAIEMLEVAKNIEPNEVSKVENIDDILINTVSIKTKEHSKAIGKPIGEYITFTVGDFKETPVNFNNNVLVIAERLRLFIENNALTQEGTIIIVGLGNASITPDALGPKVISYILATRHIISNNNELPFSNVCAIAPGVLGQTGIEVAEIIESLCRSLKPRCVIVVDALASKSIHRLGKTIQMSNTGICPGSGVQNSRKALNYDTLKVPVIAIGVPTVVDMQTIVSELSKGAETDETEMMVTPREIDLVIEHSSKMVAFALDKALHSMLTVDDIVSLVG